jgi:Asp-tRNA(Asn)/Glu-tRNA(Gln) amidotransferase A subunit family amidase
LRPAAYNGIVGFKPTIGWAPIDGVQPVAPAFDTIGVMARRVDDAAAVAAAIADDPEAFAVRPAPSRPRIGLLGDAFYDEVAPAVRTILTAVVRRFVDAGATVESVSAPVALTRVHAAHRIITFAQCAAQHADRYHRDPSRYGRRARELLDPGLITSDHPGTCLCVHAEDVRRNATERLVDLFHDVDVVVTPVTSGPVPPRATTGDSRFQIPWTLCGFPALALPSGEARGLPLAVRLVTTPTNEATLLAVARWCEQVLDLGLAPAAAR